MLKGENLIQCEKIATKNNLLTQFTWKSTFTSGKSSSPSFSLPFSATHQ